MDITTIAFMVIGIAVLTVLFWICIFASVLRSALYLFLAPFTKPVGAVERALAELERRDGPVVQDEAAALARRQPAE